MPVSFKSSVLFQAVPVARAYIRYAPWTFGKMKVWKSFFWRRRNIVARTQFGEKMLLRTNELIQSYIYYFGRWEPNLTNFVRQRLTGCGDRVFVDVGANVGYFTLMGANLLHRGSVVSIEAYPPTFTLLNNNIALNALGNIRALNYAATDSAKDVKMFYSGEDNEGTTTSRPGKHQTESTVSTVVNGLPLTDILSSSEIEKVRLLKIDVEGAELEVLSGLYSIIDRMPRDVEIVFEVTPEKSTRVEIERCMREFKRAGFNAYSIENKYDPNYYIHHRVAQRPQRLRSTPTRPEDIVLSRIDADFL